MGAARFANVGHINEPVRERNWLPFHSLHRLITARTYHYWNLCFVRSEHGPVLHQRIPMEKYVRSVALLLINKPRHDSETSLASFPGLAGRRALLKLAICGYGEEGGPYVDDAAAQPSSRRIIRAMSVP